MNNYREIIKEFEKRYTPEQLKNIYFVITHKEKALKEFSKWLLINPDIHIAEHIYTHKYSDDFSEEYYVDLTENKILWIYKYDSTKEISL